MNKPSKILPKIRKTQETNKQPITTQKIHGISSAMVVGGVWFTPMMPKNSAITEARKIPPSKDR